MGKPKRSLEEMGLGSDLPPVIRGAIVGAKAGKGMIKEQPFWTRERFSNFLGETKYRANRATSPVKGKKP